MVGSKPWMRATLTAVLMTVLGLAMHGLAGGHSDYSPAAVLLLIPAIAVTRIFQGRPGSIVRVISLLLLGQVAVHIAVNPLGGHAGSHLTHLMAPTPATAGHASMLRRSGEAYGPQIVAGIAEALSGLLASPGMLAAHSAAAAAVGWWLAAGERRSIQFLALLAGVCLWILAGAVAALRAPIRPSRPQPRPTETPWAGQRHLVSIAATPLRGPPALI